MGDFQAEIDSIRAAASWMETNAIATAQNLKDTMAKLNTYAVQSDWSGVPSCIAFGASYNAAIVAYDSLAADLLEDARKMRDTLNQIATEYEHADESSRAGFDARMAALGTESYMTHSAADQTYQQHKGDLHSDDPTAAAPGGGDADTGGTGSQPAPPAPTTTGNGRVRME